LKSCATPEVSWPTASQPLHPAKCAFYLLTLLDLRQQLTIGSRQLVGPLLHTRFQFLVESSTLILSLTPSQPGLHHADQRGGMKWPLQKRNVAECLHEPSCRGIALQSATMASQQNERKIRPRLLSANPLGKLPAIAAIHRFFGKDGDAAAVRDLLSEFAEVRAD